MKAKFRIWQSMHEGDTFPFHVLERVESDHSRWWSIKYQWNSRGNFRTLEEAEERIKNLAKCPYQYDKNGERIS